MPIFAGLIRRKRRKSAATAGSLLQVDSSKVDYDSLVGLGQYLDSLLANYSWIGRRVETIQFLDAGRWERRITLDLACPELTRRAEAAGILGKGLLPIVVAILPKGLLLDVDLLDQTHRSLPVLTSEQDSAAATTLIAAIYARAAHAPLEGWILERIRALTQVQPDDATYLLAVAKLACSTAESKHIGTQLEFFSSHFLMMTEVKLAAATMIMKYRIVETTDQGDRRGPFEAFCFSPQTVFLESPTIGQSQRDHLRIVAPPGMFIDSVQLYVDEKPWNEQTYQARVAAERAVVYTSGLPPADYFILAGLRPSPTGSFTVAWLLSLGSLAALLAGLVGQQWGQILTDQDQTLQAGPILGGLLAILSLGSANIVRSDEHELAKHTLAPLRYLLGLSALVTASAPLSLLVEADAKEIQTTWLSASGFAFVVALVLSTSWIVSRIRFRKRVRRQHRTVKRTVLNLGDESLPDL